MAVTDRLINFNSYRLTNVHYNSARQTKKTLQAPGRLRTLIVLVKINDYNNDTWSTRQKARLVDRLADRLTNSNHRYSPFYTQLSIPFPVTITNLQINI